MASKMVPAPPKNLVEAASAGGFVVTEEGGRPIIDAIGKVRAELEAHRKTLQQIDREPYLSNTPGGKFVSDHDRLVAAGDEQSLREVLTQAEQVHPARRAAGRRPAGQTRRSSAEPDPRP